MTGYVARSPSIPDARLAVVVLTNGDNANPASIERAVCAAAGRAHRRPTPRPPPPRRRLPAGDAYVGTFRNPRRFTVEVVRQGDGLVLKRFGRDFPMRFVVTGPLLRRRCRAAATETIAFGLAPGRPRRLPADERVGAGPRDPVAMPRSEIARGALAADCVRRPRVRRFGAASAGSRPHRAGAAADCAGPERYVVEPSA